MTDVTSSAPSDDGLQAERTALSWTRTSFAVCANGALLILKNLHGYSGAYRLVPSTLAALLALLTYLIGIRRKRILTRRPLPKRITPRREVRLIGISVLVVIVVTTLMLPV